MGNYADAWPLCVPVQSKKNPQKFRMLLFSFKDTHSPFTSPGYKLEIALLIPLWYPLTSYVILHSVILKGQPTVLTRIFSRNFFFIPSRRMTWQLWDWSSTCVIWGAGSPDRGIHGSCVMCWSTTYIFIIRSWGWGLSAMTCAICIITWAICIVNNCWKEEIKPLIITRSYITVFQ